MGKDARYSHSWVLYYDGDCSFCTRVVRSLSRIDFFSQIVWTPYQTLEKPPRGLSWADLDDAAYMDTGLGNLHEGFYAFRMLTLRLVPLLPLAPIFWFPGVNIMGVAVYRWVARNRYRLSRCKIPRFKVKR